MPDLLHGSAAEIRRAVAEMIRPPQETTVAESAARNLKIVNPAGAVGNWDPETAPYMVEPMNLARSRLYEAIVFMGPARSGKTIALLEGVMTYSIVDDPADCMVLQTSQQQAEDYSKTRIKRAIHGSPELASRLSPRSTDDNVYLKAFRSGMNIRFGWPSLGQLSGKDIRRMFMTDVDNFTGDLTIDEAFGLALKRIQTYMSAGILIAESSPEKDYDKANWQRRGHEAPPAAGIASLYNRGDRRLYYWRCLECRTPFAAEAGLDLFHLPDFDELLDRVLEEDLLVMAERHAFVHCPHCGVGIEPRWKQQLNAGGRWVADGQQLEDDGSITGEARRTRIASFWLGGVAAAYQPWVSLIERYLQAVKQYASTGETKPLKSTTNVDQAMNFLPPSARAQRDANELQERAEAMVQGTVPAGAVFLTAQVDVQAGKRRGFVIEVRAWGAGGEKWTIDRYSLKNSRRLDAGGQLLPLDPAGYVEDWDRLVEKCIDRRYPLDDESGRTMPVRLTVCDSGGEDGVTSRAYEFARELKRQGKGHRFRLVKGGSTANAPRVQEVFPDTRKRADRKTSGAAGDVPVLLLNTNALKDKVAADLRRETPGPGYWHLPDWMPTSSFDELLAETRTAKGWLQIGGRKNESIDLAVYGEAAFLHLKADRINWKTPPAWAAPWDSNPDVRADGEPVAIQRRKPRVVRSFPSKRLR